MRLFRLAAIFALLAFVFTTSGLAAFAHERIEHDSPTAQKSSEDSEPNSHPDKPGHPAGGHCPTCQSLGGMVKSIVHLPVIAIVVESAPVYPEVPVLEIVGSLDIAPTPISSRGPPAC